jgi:hypothetical protein
MLNKFLGKAKLRFLFKAQMPDLKLSTTKKLPFWGSFFVRQAQEEIQSCR